MKQLRTSLVSWVVTHVRSKNCARDRCHISIANKANQKPKNSSRASDCSYLLLVLYFAIKIAVVVVVTIALLLSLLLFRLLFKTGIGFSPWLDPERHLKPEQDSVASTWAIHPQSPGPWDLPSASILVSPSGSSKAWTNMLVIATQKT